MLRYVLTVLLFVPRAQSYFGFTHEVCDSVCDMPWCEQTPRPAENFTPVHIIAPDRKNLAELGGRQYYFGMEAYVSAEEAVSLCKQLDMVLLSAETEEENDLVRKYLTSLDVGMEWFWSAGQRLNNGTWVWRTNGQSFTEFTDWVDTRPDLSPEYPTCLTISGQMQWWDDPCTFRWKFVCEQNY